jgi:pimeloyl-ACP methyl ester carboxylesterase
MPRWLKISFPILYRVLSFLKLMGPFPSYEAAEALARKLPAFQAWSPLQRLVLRQSLEQKPDGQWGSKFTIAARNQTFEDVMTVAGLTQPLDIPTLLVQPDQGLNRKDWQLHPYRTYLNQLKIESVPGNHWPFLGEPEAFNHAVQAFLRNGDSIKIG